MNIQPEIFLRHCFNIVLDTADPRQCLPKFLPDDRDMNVIVIGAGKASSSMAKAFEDNWVGHIQGAVIVPYGHKDICNHIKTFEASHPTPDQNSVLATKNIISTISNLSCQDHVFVLLSGGGSSLLCQPPHSISLDEKQTINKKLLYSGASINEINTVRKHLSLIKGGRLAELASPAKVYTYVISDVIGNDPSIIASGPTVEDPSSRYDAIKILNKYSLDCPKSIWEWLQNPASESIKKIGYNNHYKIIASAQDALKKVGEYCYTQGIHFINLGELSGDAAKLGSEHALIAKQIRNDAPTLIYSGGETTVKVKGTGKGGRNTEYLLNLAFSLNDTQNVYALACDTDGIDGSGDNAGAIINPESLKKFADFNIEVKAFLDNNDSYSAFKKIDSLITTGPTKTNINDFRAILIMPN